MSGIINTTKRFVKNNGSTILSVLAMAGVVTTTVLAVKATPKALELIKEDSRKNHDGDPYAYTKKEAVASAWSCYIPTFVSAGATICCIASSSILNKKAQESLTGAYIFLENSFREYKNKVKELYGEEVHNAVIDAIVKEHASDDVYISAPRLFSNYSLDISDSKEKEKKRLFYDTNLNKYFETSLARVLEAEYHVNRNYVLRGFVSANEWCDFLGLGHIDNGDVLSWSAYESELCWVDFDHRLTHLDDGTEVVIIESDEFWPDLYEYEELDTPPSHI